MSPAVSRSIFGRSTSTQVPACASLPIRLRSQTAPGEARVKAILKGGRLDSCPLREKPTYPEGELVWQSGNGISVRLRRLSPSSLRRLFSSAPQHPSRWRSDPFQSAVPGSFSSCALCRWPFHLCDLTRALAHQIANRFVTHPLRFYIERNWWYFVCPFPVALKENRD